ncbi:MAG TPA: MMPL family transporter [Thermoleophilaceae bacterium]|nr:MMPL family transporter [Thermoleophilaceae bacterium]
MLDRVAHLTWRRPKLVLAVVGALTLLAIAVGHDVEHRLKAAGFTDSASESERAIGLLRDRLGHDAGPGIVLLVRARGHGRLDTADPAVRRDVARLAALLERTRYVGRVVNPLERPAEGAALVGRDGRSLVISGELSTQDVENDGGEAAKDAKERIGRSRWAVKVGVAGYAPSFNEVNDQTREDLTKAELIAFPALAVLLLLVFRGVVAAAIPLLLGGMSIVGTMLVLTVMSELVDTSIFALNLTTALSLGLGVDYALLMVSRYREELERAGPGWDAHRITVLTAGRTAMFSGLTVAAAMAALVVMPQRFLYSIGVAGAAVGALSALVAVLVVPSLLALLGTRVNSLAVRRGPAVSDESDSWYRLAWAVMRRPVAVGLASALLLGALAVPLFSTTLTGPSAEAVPPGAASYEPTAYIQRHYPRDITEAVTVTVQGRASPAELARYGRSLRRAAHATRASPFARASRDVSFANLALPRPALSARSQDSVRAIRALPPPGDTRVLVSGNTARFIDQKRSLADHLPLVVVLVAVPTLVLLFLLTGSVVLPLKTLLMNALTLAATLGVIVLAFEDGVLHGPLDYTGPSAVEVTSLVFLFAVVFGLATDYAVLVLARIKEQHDRGVPNEEAVAIGIGRTGRVITAAALCIAVVFGAFAVSSVFFMKEIAVGQAVGVLLDATIVRALLVPSLMRLLGDWNWWAPRPLRVVYRRFGLREG